MPRFAPIPREDFTSLLDARARSAGTSLDAVAASSRHGPTIRSLEGIIESASKPLTGPRIDAADALARVYADEPAPTSQPPAPACDQETIAHELQLTPKLTPRQLERIRRDFALANHPDRVAPVSRDLATRRMTLANMLIDQALQAKRKQPSR